MNHLFTGLSQFGGSAQQLTVCGRRIFSFFLFYSPH